jgi:hypothetical protein
MQLNAESTMTDIYIYIYIIEKLVTKAGKYFGRQQFILLKLVIATNIAQTYVRLITFLYYPIVTDIGRVTLL